MVKNLIPWFVGALFSAILLHGVLLFLGVYALSADESGRVYDTLLWMTKGEPYSKVWLPGYRVILAGALHLWYDVFWVPRILSFLFGMCALGAGVWVAHEVWKNRTVTAYTALLLAVFPQRVLLSVVPLTEILFIALVLTALAAFIRWRSTEHTKYLLLATLALAGSTTIRYEGWGFSLLFAFLLLYGANREKQCSVLKGVFFVSLLALFPLAWLIRNAILHGTPFTFLETTIDVNLTIPLSRRLWHNPFTQFLFINAFSFNLFGLLSFTRWKDHLAKMFLLLPLVIFSLGLLISDTLPTHTPWRVTALWGIALVPFTAAWIVEWCGEGNWKRHRLVFTGLFFAFCVQSIVFAKHYSSTDSSFTAEERTVAAVIQTILSSSHRDTKVLIETSHWRYLHVLVASQYPFRFTLNGDFRPNKQIEGMLALPCDQLNGALQSKKISLIVVESDILKHTLPQCEFVRILFQNNRWTLFGVR